MHTWLQGRLRSARYFCAQKEKSNKPGASPATSTTALRGAFSLGLRNARPEGLGEENILTCTRVYSEVAEKSTHKDKDIKKPNANVAPT